MLKLVQGDREKERRSIVKYRFVNMYSDISPTFLSNTKLEQDAFRFFLNQAHHNVIILWKR